MPNRFKNNAFTMVEVVIGMSISLTLFAVVYNLLFSTLNTNKVNEDFTNNIFQTRKVIIRLQKELRDARDLIYPAISGDKRVTSSDHITYKDSLNRIKTIYFDQQSQQLRQFEVIIDPQTKKMELKPLNKPLGTELDNVQFTRDSFYLRHIQLRVVSGKYSLIGGVEMLNG